jgi:hypothetical protein
MSIPTVIALFVLFVILPLNWYVTWRLWLLHKANPTIRVLRERGIVSTALSLLISLFAFIFLNNDLVPPPFAFEDTKLLTRGAMLLAGFVPAVYWLWLYREG